MDAVGQMKTAYKIKSAKDKISNGAKGMSKSVKLGDDNDIEKDIPKPKTKKSSKSVKIKPNKHVEESAPPPKKVQDYQQMVYIFIARD